MTVGLFPLFLIAKWILIRITTQNIVEILYATKIRAYGCILHSAPVFRSIVGSIPWTRILFPSDLVFLADEIDIHICAIKSLNHALHFPHPQVSPPPGRLRLVQSQRLNQSTRGRLRVSFPHPGPWSPWSWGTVLDPCPGRPCTVQSRTVQGQGRTVQCPRTQGFGA